MNHDTIAGQVALAVMKAPPEEWQSVLQRAGSLLQRQQVYDSERPYHAARRHALSQGERCYTGVNFGLSEPCNA